jgi:hypothetical protein
MLHVHPAQVSAGPAVAPVPHGLCGQRSHRRVVGWL